MDATALISHCEVWVWQWWGWQWCCYDICMASAGVLFLSLSFSLFLSLSLSFSLFLSLSLSPLSFSLSLPSLSLSFSLSLSLSPVNHIPVAMLLPGILSNVLLYTIQLACTKTDSISVLLAVYMVESVELYNAQGFLKGCGEGIFPLGRCLPPFENLY